VTADLKAALKRLLEAAGRQMEHANELADKGDLDVEGPLANCIQALMLALSMARSEKSLQPNGRYDLNGR